MKTQDAKYLMLKERQEAEVGLMTDREGRAAKRDGWGRGGKRSGDGGVCMGGAGEVWRQVWGPGRQVHRLSV